MVVEAPDLRRMLVRACDDAGLDRGTVAAWIVDAVRPPGATPIAYLHPAGVVRPGTVRIFRAVGAERAVAHRGRHRIAVWRSLPRVPAAALGPMVRHELAHAARWERSGPAFYAADERLRAATGGHAYALLPTEREANAAAAAFARRTLAAPELAQLAAVTELSDLLASTPPADVVGETLTLLGEGVAVAPAAVEQGGGEPFVELVPPGSAEMS